MRSTWRKRAARLDASLVQADITQIGPALGFFAVIKSRDGLKAKYSGSLLVPLAAPHYEIRMDAEERGITGQRDAIVTACLAQRGEIRLELPDARGGPARISGFCEDPYDPQFDRDTLNCVSDDERVDLVLSDHPLSRMRRTLALIRESLTFAPGALLEGTGAAVPDASRHAEPRRGRLSHATAGTLLFKARLFDQSEAAFAASIAEHEMAGRPLDVDIAQQLLGLGLSRDCQGKHRESIPAYERAEQVARTFLEPGHPLIAMTINNRARALIALNDHAAAEPAFEQALQMFHALEGQQTNAAIALNGMGMVRNAQERWAEAIPFLEKALKIFDAAIGPDAPDCGDVSLNLARAYAHVGDVERAQQALDNVKRIRGE
jgi:hypothetical protein